MKCCFASWVINMLFVPTDNEILNAKYYYVDNVAILTKWMFLHKIVIKCCLCSVISPKWMYVH